MTLYRPAKWPRRTFNDVGPHVGPHVQRCWAVCSIAGGAARFNAGGPYVSMQEGRTFQCRRALRFNAGGPYVSMQEGRTFQCRGIFSYTPEPHVAFCPIMSTHFFPCLNPIFKNGSFLSVVALV